MNYLRERIKKREKIYGTITSLTDPCICEIFGKTDYDYIWIDMEHTYISYKEVLCHLNAAKSTNTPTIIRVPQNDLTVTKKILEMGADGIIFPMVRTAKEVDEFIKSTLYPPYGTRGFGPMRAIGYGAEDVLDYVDNKSLDYCRFVQIEHLDCISNLEEIAKNPYIDGFIFGPNDLSGSMGKLGHVFDEDVAENIDKAISIVRKNEKYVGVAVGFDEQTIKYWTKFDVDMFTVGADWNFLYTQSRTVSKRMQEILKNKD